MRISTTTICRRRQPAVLDRRCRAAIAPLRTPTATSHATDSVETRPNFAFGRRNTTIRYSPCPAWQRLAQSDLDSVLQDSLVECTQPSQTDGNAHRTVRCKVVDFVSSGRCGEQGGCWLTRNVMLADIGAYLCDAVGNSAVL